MDVKLNKAYKSAKTTKLRYRIIYGGAGSGKSHYLHQETIFNMLQDGRYRYLVIRKTGRSIKNSVYAGLQEIINEYDLNKYFKCHKTDMTIECVNGAKLTTSGLDNVEKLKSITNVNRIWIEEASEVTEKDFQQLDLRLRGKNELGYQLTLSFNPISEMHWIKKVFFDVGKENTFILKTTYKDNKFIDDEYKRNLERLIEEDYQFYRIYTLGEWGSLGNLVFDNWEKEDFDTTTFDNYYNGIDFGFAEDPFAFIRIHYDKTRKTIYVVDELCQTQTFNDEIVDMVKPIINREIVTCDSAEPKSIAELKRMGLNAKGAKKGKGSIETGIKFLQRHKIKIKPHCVNTIKEFSSYKWKEDKDGNILPKPVDKNNHMIDALRYAIESETNQVQGIKFLR